MLAMKPTPQESFSSEGSYRPSAAGRNVCLSIGCVESTGFDAATDSPGATMFSRSNSDRLILCVLSINKAFGLTVGGAALASWHPPGHWSSSASRYFLNLAWALQTLCRECGLKLRQCCCPNFDHAKFFSITQAAESRSRRANGRGLKPCSPAADLRQARRD